MIYRVCWLGLAITAWVLSTIIIQEIIYARRAPRKRLIDLRGISYHGPCRECRGDGLCHWCYGDGEVKRLFRRERITCPYCRGTGICSHCGGTGESRTT